MEQYFGKEILTKLQDFRNLVEMELNFEHVNSRNIHFRRLLVPFAQFFSFIIANHGIPAVPIRVNKVDKKLQLVARLASLLCNERVACYFAQQLTSWPSKKVFGGYVLGLV